MAGGGGDSSPQQPQVINPERVAGPLESGARSHLFPQMENMLEAALPYSQFGAGYQLLPRSPLGQTYVPGPNPTIFGNPYMYAHAEPWFGQSALNNGGGNAMGGGQSGGQGGGGGSNNQQQQPVFPMSMYPNLIPQQLQFLNPGMFNLAAFAPPQQQNPQQNQNNSNQQNQQQNQNNTQQPQQPAGPPPDPWAGTNNASTQNNPGTNMSPNGVYNANGPYAYWFQQMQQNAQQVPQQGSNLIQQAVGGAK